jgi:hypothetical protein
MPGQSFTARLRKQAVAARNTPMVIASVGGREQTTPGYVLLSPAEAEALADLIEITESWVDYPELPFPLGDALAALDRLATFWRRG